MRTFTMSVEDFRKVMQKVMDGLHVDEIMEIYNHTTRESSVYTLDSENVKIEIYEPGGSDEQDIIQFLKEIKNG